MNPKPDKLNPERVSTDESLRAEREKTDVALFRKRPVIDTIEEEGRRCREPCEGQGRPDRTNGVLCFHARDHARDGHSRAAS